MKVNDRIIPGSWVSPYLTHFLHRLNVYYLVLLSNSLIVTALLVFSAGNLREYASVMPDKNVFTKNLVPIKILPLKAKGYDDAHYKTFVKKCLGRLLTHDTYSYRTSLIGLQNDCFTLNGFNSFLEQLNGPSGILASIKKDEVWYVQDVKELTLVKEGLFSEHVYYQTFSAKLDLFRSDMTKSINYVTDVAKTEYRVKAMVVRQSNLDYPFGVAISKVVLE